jgi:two-component system cell cycle response regulator
VGSGAEAIRVLGKIIPAVVILDVMMPGMDGFEVLRWIRDNECLARLPVMMYSADPSPEAEGQALRSGAQAFLVKGRIPISELLVAVDRHAIPACGTREEAAN